MMKLDWQPLSDNMGAEIHDFDCRQPLHDAAREALLAALYRHQMLVFREQALSKQEQVAFSEHFGTLEMHVNRVDAGYEMPMFQVVSNLDEQGNIKPDPPSGQGFYGTRTWHTDKSYMPVPSLATFLHAVEVPSRGGETEFANLLAAYEALDGDTRTRLAGLECVHSWEQSLKNSGSRPVSDEERRLSPPVVHPLVRPHPATGRPALYIGMHASHIVGMDEQEGRALLFDLLDFATQDCFAFTHSWRVGDLVVWDNASLLHRGAPFDRARERRHLHRTVVRGNGSPAPLAGSVAGAL